MPDDAYVRAQRDVRVMILPHIYIYAHHASANRNSSLRLRRDEYGRIPAGAGGAARRPKRYLMTRLRRVFILV